VLPVVSYELVSGCRLVEANKSERKVSASASQLDVFIPKGFVNPSLTLCWLNSLIQVLFSTPRFIFPLMECTDRSPHLLTLNKLLIEYYVDSTSNTLDLTPFFNQCMWWRDDGTHRPIHVDQVERKTMTCMQEASASEKRDESVKVKKSEFEDVSEFFSRWHTYVSEKAKKLEVGSRYGESQCFEAFEYECGENLICSVCKNMSAVKKKRECSLFVSMTGGNSIATLVERALQHEIVNKRCNSTMCLGESRNVQKMNLLFTLPHVLLIQLQHPRDHVPSTDTHAPPLLDDEITLKTTSSMSEGRFKQSISKTYHLYAYIVHITHKEASNKYDFGHFVTYIRKRGSVSVNVHTHTHTRYTTQPIHSLTNSDSNSFPHSPYASSLVCRVNDVGMVLLR
jgi:hypothetical protein